MSVVADVLNVVYPGSGNILDKLGGLFKDKKQYAIRDQARTLSTPDQRAALYLTFIDTLPEVGKDNKRNRFNQFFENFPSDLKSMSPLMAAEWNRRIDSTSNPSALSQFRASSASLNSPFSTQSQNTSAGYNPVAAANGFFGSAPANNSVGTMPYQNSVSGDSGSEQPKDKGNNTIVIVLIVVIVIGAIAFFSSKSNK